MTPVESTYIDLGGTLIELCAAVIVAFHAAWAVARILTGHGSDDARLLIARGVLAALGFSVAGTLLKIIAIQSWPQIRLFAFVLVLRTLFKRIFLWEQKTIQPRAISARFKKNPSLGQPSLVLLLLLSSSALHAATGSHLPGSTLYPRLIRLRFAHGVLRNSILAKTGNKLFRSLDEGQTFTYLTSVPTVSLEAGNPTPDPQAKDIERCCSTIFELPRPIGRFPTGTLLYAGSFFSHGVPAIEIYTSSDAGAHWQYLSTPARSGDPHHGLWEPEFNIARNGSLVMFVSDETDPCCSQKLVKRQTRDLVVWTPKENLVASPSQPDRPGMAVASHPEADVWFLSYELCGPVGHCSVYSRTSSDGWNFGDPSSFGTKILTNTGQYLAHAPANLYLPSSRQLVLTGQMLYESDDTVSPENGKVLLTNLSRDGSGPWGTSPAPVLIPSAFDNYCPNYSSALLPTNNSRALLELASDFDEAHLCTTYFASVPLP